MAIIDKYNSRADKANSLACVGLDADFEKLPARFLKEEFPQFAFNKYIIDSTHEFAAAFKANIAFYEARGEQGLRELKLTMDYLRETHPDIFTICDAKRADIGNTNRGYVTSILDWLGFDALTLHPYLGREALEPFLSRPDKGAIILCRTSNPGAGELQDLVVEVPPSSREAGLRRGEAKPLWQIVAEKVRDEWNGNKNCMLVVGATYPEEMKTIRALMGLRRAGVGYDPTEAGEMTFLVPGIGAQGGELEAAVKAGLNSAKKGMIINSSRGVIFADDPAKAAQELRDGINKFR
ncbi:MAG: orotidine-5'-phosphate decarboxylase [Candidatus Liptonbacteria bacterium]|nr:orotidine-5'-phosphate decarboxylase [Candidatus Liptonbacteria bacterium]